MDAFKKTTSLIIDKVNKVIKFSIKYVNWEYQEYFQLFFEGWWNKCNCPKNSSICQALYYQQTNHRDKVYKENSTLNKGASIKQ